MEIIIKNRRIHYLDRGEGEVFLILHGWGAQIASVMPIINALEDRGRVICLDLPGFGQSEEPPEPYDSLDYVEVLWEFLECLQVRELHVLGHSFGGKLSILMASERPERIKKMVLIDAAGIKPKRKLSHYLKIYSFKVAKWGYRLLHRGKNQAEAMEKFYRRHGSEDYRNTSGVMRKTIVKVVNEDFTDRLPHIQAPTLLFWGSLDQDTPLYMAQKMERLIPDAGLVVAEGAGHFSYLDQYNLFVSVIRSFFS